MANIKNAAISITGAGDNTVITGISGQTIRVRRLMLINSVATAQAVTIKDGASTSLTGAIGLPSSIGGGFILNDIPEQTPLFVMSTGNDFIVNLANATAVAGFVSYTLG